MQLETGTPMLLSGNAYARGRAQAACGPVLADAVREAVSLRLGQATSLLARADVRAFLDRQEADLEGLDPNAAAETRGIADGFGIDYAALLTYLHLGLLRDFAEDGCSAWAWGKPGADTVLVKNRDYRGEHVALQRVFLHRDPARPGEALLCVGSLGSPGAFSSGMNAKGLAIVDTHVSTRDHGPGLLRYFLMTWLLWTCADVEEALGLIAALPHAGGGCIVLADAGGGIAAVELGHSAQAVERRTPFVVKTNHFVDPACAPFWFPVGSDPMARSTLGRYARLQSWLGDRRERPPLADIAALMGGHGADGEEALCRHGQDGDSSTISCSAFAPSERRLYFSAQHPCAGAWSLYDCRP
ncbi:C45 family peptidase [Chelatococcus asaccharovorans]|uniref:C45 family peptidase n=1 Tax=Chelatococcus asaccharovorans TaxID=28210 RepID=UPI00224C7611|nr:C45 family peptidase [Chelatococcus asaccharovorans]CAH1672717.1 Acyl-CoA:6-aminopenicillanic acid acyl transferase [Chelatococcus asaccharovorans]CAH1675875.1 Acyl-CoA:6-aminopenicillanic acid acyl transferase [Chelatococcus asaccharovorans]